MSKFIDGGWSTVASWVIKKEILSLRVTPMCLDTVNRPFNNVQIFRGHQSLCAVIDWHSLEGKECVYVCYYGIRTENELLKRFTKHPALGQVLKQSVANVQSLSACCVVQQRVKLGELFSQIEESAHVKTDAVMHRAAI